MEIKTIKSEDNYLEIEVIGEDVSFVNAIREIAMQDEDVEFASCTLSHPQTGSPRLIIRTKKKDPHKVISAAAKELASEAEKFKKAVKE